MAKFRREPRQGVVEASLTHDGRGVVKEDARVYFVEGALPGELIRFTPMRKSRGHIISRLDEILEASADRVAPACSYFGVCGGCAMQHLNPSKQIEFKEQTLRDNLARLGRVEPENWLEPLQAEDEQARWHYRRKARPGVRFVEKKGGVLLGFRERASSYITSLQYCLAMDKRLSDLLPSLHGLIASLSIPDRIPQVEVAAADNAVALVFRHLEPLTDADISELTQYAVEHQLQVFLQSSGLDSIEPLAQNEPEPLYYSLNKFNLRLEFRPTDFIQVNKRMNERLTSLAITQLALDADDKVLDLFCGLGNFTLPIARSGAEVLGVEGDAALVAHGEHNAQINQLTNASFMLGDLYQEGVADSLPQSGFNKLLLDPPRSGALEVVKHYLPKLRPERVVYVSCNPASLARDAAIMVHHGYRFELAGVVDMFPHTAHVESIGVFSLNV